MRRFTADDAAVLAELHADPRVMRYIDDGKPVAREVTIGTALPAILDQYARLPAGLGRSTLVERSSGRFVGWVGLGPVSSVGLAAAEGYELGFRLHPEFWRHGFASEAARALVDHAFAEHSVPRIVATTMTVNRGSRGVLENAGLRYVRTFFEQWPEYIEGVEHGDVEYALDIATWRTSRTG